MKIWKTASLKFNLVGTLLGNLKLVDSESSKVGNVLEISDLLFSGYKKSRPYFLYSHS